MWTAETRQAADAAWIEFKTARELERRRREHGYTESADEYKRMADAAYHRWEAACRAAGLL